MVPTEEPTEEPAGTEPMSPPSPEEVSALNVLFVQLGQAIDKMGPDSAYGRIVDRVAQLLSDLIHGSGESEE